MSSTRKVSGWVTSPAAQRSSGCPSTVRRSCPDGTVSVRRRKLSLTSPPACATRKTPATRITTCARPMASPPARHSRSRPRAPVLRLGAALAGLIAVAPSETRTLSPSPWLSGAASGVPASGACVGRQGVAGVPRALLAGVGRAGVRSALAPAQATCDLGGDLRHDRVLKGVDQPQPQLGRLTACAQAHRVAKPQAVRLAVGEEKGFGAVSTELKPRLARLATTSTLRSTAGSAPVDSATV